MADAALAAGTASEESHGVADVSGVVSVPVGSLYCFECILDSRCSSIL